MDKGQEERREPNKRDEESKLGNGMEQTNLCYIPHTKDLRAAVFRGFTQQ